MNNIKEILRFGDGSTDDWIKILFQNGNIASYPLRKLKVVKDRTQDDDVKNFIAYLKKVATIIKDFPQDDKDFFQRELDKLNISAESILSKIIANEPIKSNKVSGEMIFPLRQMRLKSKRSKMLWSMIFLVFRDLRARENSDNFKSIGKPIVSRFKSSDRCRKQ